MARNTLALYGRNTLKEYLLQKERKGDRETVIIYLTKEAREEREVSSLIDKHKPVKVQIVTMAEINSKVGSVNHQGVVFEVYESDFYTPIEDILRSAQNSERSLIVLLDELEDPHNVGAIIRSAAAFGASGVILPERRAAHVTESVVRASSGLVFAVPIAIAANTNSVIEKCKKDRFWVYGLAGEGKEVLGKAELDDKTLLIVGSEGKGVREKTKEHCDFLLSIPMSPLCESLNASVAASLALFEWSKKN